jgi:hypothetical protein
VASPFLASSWEHLSAVVWAAPSFVLSQNMSHSDNGQAVAAAATSLVKLCPYDEEELVIWFCLIEAEFAAAASGHKSSGTPMLQQACPIKSFVTFWTQSMSATKQVNILMFLKEVLLRQCLLPPRQSSCY